LRENGVAGVAAGVEEDCRLGVRSVEHQQKTRYFGVHPGDVHLVPLGSVKLLKFIVLLDFCVD